MRRPVAIRLVGPMQWIVYPSLLAAAATFVLATPVELFGLNLPQPVIPLVLAFAWPIIRPSILGPVALFALGLFVDLLWYGPLGLWPFCLIAVYAGVMAVRNLLLGQEVRILFGAFGVACGVAFLLAYLLTMMMAGNAPSLISLFLQVLPTLLLFPLANGMIERFDDGDVRFR